MIAQKGETAMNSQLTRIAAAMAGAFGVFAASGAIAADVVVRPAAGDSFRVTDTGGGISHLRVAETGGVWIPVAATGAEQATPVCAGGDGALGPCPPAPPPPGPGDFELPYAASLADAGTLFALTNTGDGAAIEGTNTTSTANIVAVRGIVSSTAPGGFSAGVRGINNGTGGLGIGVWGSQDGSGWGVYGSTPNGLGVYGNATANGTGVYANSNTGTGMTATSNNGTAAEISIFNNANNNVALSASSVGNGTVVNVSSTGNGAGVRSSTGPGFSVHGITSAQTSAGIVGDNNGAGEAVVGRTTSDIAGAVVGRNDGGGYGVRGFIATDTTGTAVGVLGQVGLNNSAGRAGRFENFNTNNQFNTFEVETNGNGNIPDNTQGNAASFRVSNSNSVAAAVRGEVTTIFGNFGAAAIFGTSSGTGGYAGLFHASNPAGNGAALVSLSDGNGNAITANANTGNAVEANVDGDGIAMYGWVPSFADGRAARFVNFNETNANPVVTAETRSNGDIAIFRAGAAPANVARINNAGRGFFNGGTQVGGADVAEFVPTSGDEPQPGDVVEIDPERPEHFRLSTEANSTRVAGVISTDPGVTLNARTGAVQDVRGPALALVGRVPVKVTAEGGPIAIGDLLVASPTPGHAMRAPANPAAGTVVGKALEALDGRGRDVIEMLVMLR
jgi:hypothetical protein